MPPDMRPAVFQLGEAYESAAAVLEVLPGGVVFTAEKGAANAAAYYMVPGGIRK